MRDGETLHRVSRAFTTGLVVLILAAAGQAVALASDDAVLWNVGQRTSVDGRGNVYVTESRERPGTRLDYVTSKYDRRGTQLWMATYDGPASGDDRVQAIAIDGKGNVYVTGQSQGPDGTYDYATVKYGPRGDPIWVARYAGAGEDYAKAIAVGAKGDVYVTGFSGNLGGGADYVTIHYDPRGVKQWTARYDGPGAGDDLASGIALDAEGFVYVTGKSMGAGTGFDFATVKYAVDGSEAWVARYNRAGSDSDEAFHVDVDASGDVVVRGMSYGPGGSTRDVVTVTYGRDGRQLSAPTDAALAGQGLPSSLSPSCKPPRWIVEARNTRRDDSGLGIGESSFLDSLSDGDRTYSAAAKAIAADLDLIGCLFDGDCSVLSQLLSIAGLFDTGWGEQSWDSDGYGIVLRLDGEPGVEKRISVEAELEGLLAAVAAAAAVAKAEMWSSLSFDGDALISEYRSQGAALAQCRAEGVKESRARLLPNRLSVGDELTILGKLKAQAGSIVWPGYGVSVALSVFDPPLQVGASSECKLDSQVDVSEGGLRFAAHILNDPPDARCRNVMAEAGPTCTAAVSIDGGTSDSDCDAFTLAQDPPGPYTLGDTPVKLTATETGGLRGSDSCSGTVTVEDLTPPRISRLSASPSVLWPSDHRMVPVTVTVSARDNCGEAVCRIVGVTSNEPVASGPGDPAPDWKITGALTASLRSERLGGGSGRDYAITVECRDGSGNGVRDVVNVTVPHDRRGI